MNIEEKLILSPNKTESASYARGIISSIAKKEKIPVEEIAKVLGRDGSTISSLISRRTNCGDIVATIKLVVRVRLGLKRMACF